MNFYLFNLGYIWLDIPKNKINHERNDYCWRYCLKRNEQIALWVNAICSLAVLK